MAEAFLQSGYGCLHHRRVTAFGKHDTLWMESCCSMERTRELGLLAQHLLQPVLVFIPVGDGSSRYPTLDSSFGHSRRHFRDKTRVNRLRDEVFRTELQVGDMINLIDDVGHRLLGEIGNSSHSSKLHLLVDGLGVDVKGTAEDVREADDIIDLVRIIGTPRRHQDVGTRGNGILIGDFRHRIGKRKDNRHMSHGANHILTEDIAL